jgi:tripartite-type tricarboxylate transporter receptor subunit TctC
MKVRDVRAFLRNRSRAWALVILAALASAAQAQSPAAFPERPVRLLSSNPPGGAGDLMARAMARGLTEIWKQPVVVDNKTGASGVIAADILAKAPPDGHTLFMVPDTTLVVVPFVQEKMPYDTLTDLVPVGLTGAAPLVLVAHPSLNVRQLAELVALARTKPGTIDYGSGGQGSVQHIAMVALQRQAGMTLSHIPYKGGAPALQDVVAGRVPVMFAGISTALPFIKDGKLVPLAAGTLKRSPLMPDVPTVAELGYPGFEASPWAAVMAPKGTPPALVDRISADLEKVTRTDAYREALVKLGNEVRSSTPRELAERIRTEYEANRALIKAAGIKAD